MPSPRFVLPLLLVLTGATLAGCQPRTVSDTTAAIYCEVMADAPVRDNDEHPKQVVATTRFRCDEPGASSMKLTMHLQHQNAAGNWVDLIATSFTAKGRDTVPATGEAFRSRQISANCLDGAFRTKVNGSSQARGRTKTYDLTGPRSFEPCRPSFFSGKD